MVKISCKIKAKYGYKRIEKLQKELPKVIKSSVEEILKNIQGCAIRLEKGHHEDGILCELVDLSNNKVKGKVYADVKAFPFFMFEHYGTGAYAEMEHVGKTEHFIKSGYVEWFIPVAIAPKPLPYPIVTINEAQFYIAHGVRANHFMTDSEFETRDSNVEIVEKNIYKLLEEVCK